MQQGTDLFYEQERQWASATSTFLIVCLLVLISRSLMKRLPLIKKGKTKYRKYKLVISVEAIIGNECTGEGVAQRRAHSRHKVISEEPVSRESMGNRRRTNKGPQPQSRLPTSEQVKHLEAHLYYMQTHKSIRKKYELNEHMP